MIWAPFKFLHFGRGLPVEPVTALNHFTVEPSGRPDIAAVLLSFFKNFGLDNTVESTRMKTDSRL